MKTNEKYHLQKWWKCRDCSMIYNHYRPVLQSKSLESSRAFLTQKPLVLRICEHFLRNNRQILFRKVFFFFLHLHRTNRQELLRLHLPEGVSHGGHDLRPKSNSDLVDNHHRFKSKCKHDLISWLFLLYDFCFCPSRTGHLRYGFFKK